MLAPYPADRLHNQHPPPPASNQSRQPNSSSFMGSILDADPPAQGVKIARRNTANRAKVVSWADRLLAADALVLIYPVWNEGFTAILKGFFDRVFIPGVSLSLAPDGSAVPNLTNL